MVDRVYARRKLTPKERILSQWRGVDEADATITRVPASRSMTDMVRQVSQKIRLDKRMADNEILKVWNSLIDPNVTAHAQPCALANGTLIVNVDSNVWLDELVRYRRHEILGQLQNCFGRKRLQRISFRVG